RDLLDRRPDRAHPAPPATAEVLAALGTNAMRRRAYREAEPLLRQGLALRERTDPDGWQTFHMRSLLGEALLGQARHPEAEPLLVRGYEGLKSRAAEIPGPSRTARLTEASRRLVRLYSAWSKPGQEVRWRAELAGWNP